MSPLEMEIEEKSVEDAIEAACRKFGLPRDMLEIEILAKGSSGIFGIVGAKKAKIRARAKARPLEPATERAKAILSEMLSYVDLPSEIECEAREDCIYLNILSNGSGLLIGKRGKTLNAFQHLVSKILQREMGENISVIVDTEQYRTKRETNLAELAHELCDKVKKTRRPLTTGPMNAQDRRVIHLALKDDQDVRTKSKGEGNLRRVVIYPVKKGKASSSGPEEPTPPAGEDASE